MRTRMRRRARTSIRRFVAVGCVVAGAVAAGAPAEAALRVVGGDVYCHATAAGPRYFHSGVTQASWSLPAWGEWLSLDDDARQRLERRTLDGLAVEFARRVAERQDVDVLLSPRCDLTPMDAAAAVIDAAAYYRGGVMAPYPSIGKIAVDWTPDFGTDLEQRVAARARALAGPEPAGAAALAGGDLIARVRGDGPPRD